MSSAVATKRKGKEPGAAKPCDLKELARPNATRKRRERLEYLFASGEKPRDPGPTPTVEEQEFWRERFRENPFLLVRHKAFLIKTKSKGLQRFEPNDEQLEVLDFIEWCWERKIIPEPVILKCRQDGMSTLSELCLLACEVAIGECYSHVVANSKKNCTKMLKIQRNALLGLPLWMRPELGRDNDETLEIDDEAAGIVGVQVQTDTARAGEDIGRGDPAQFRHYTEVEFWDGQQDCFAALEAAQVWEFPALHIMETTGKQRESPYYNDWHEANRWWKDGRGGDPDRPGRRAFFFPWYRHKAYQKDLPPGVTEEEFWERMDPADRIRFEAHGCNARQAAWYLAKRKSQLDKRVPLDKFRREFPFDPDEAFLGGTFQVFDKQPIKEMQTLARFWKLGRLADIGRTAAPKEIPEGWKPIWARAQLIWNPATPEPPRFKDAAHVGEWFVWELPRVGHHYVVACDVASGIINETTQEPDWSVIDVWRWSYDSRLDAPKIVQVAQLRSQIVPPEELAQAAYAVSCLYKCRDERPARIIFERNNHGSAFEQEARRHRGVRLHEHISTDGHSVRFVSFGIQATRGGANVERSKNTLVANLRVAIQDDVLRVQSLDSLRELSLYTRNEKGIYGAPRNENDDTVSACYLMCEAVRVANRDVLDAVPVIADGDVNLAVQPDDDEIAEALLEVTFRKHRPKPMNKKAARRKGGWRGGI